MLSARLLSRVWVSSPGVLLNEFLKAAAAVVGGESARRVHVYSAHDYNVYSLMAVSRISPRQGVPKYGSVFSLELRKVTATGKYVVLVSAEWGETVRTLGNTWCSHPGTSHFVFRLLLFEYDYLEVTVFT